ncbi:MAG: terminase family protein [Clostridia bacterium]|nr:terminase family protein [Clostridia bacterium]
MTDIIWAPQEKQRIFMSRPEYEALYGGAAGGGKSDALVIEALRQVEIPYYKALILRKTFPELSELIEKSQNYYPRAYPGARYNASSHTWRFPSGAKIVFGAMQHEEDKTRYQGRAFDFIAFDELTHFTRDEYVYMFSRNRPNGPGTRVYIRATANPGGVGHAWVKERFITAAPPLTPVKSVVSWREPDGKIREKAQYRVFVPSTVFDNGALIKNDPLYVSRLAALPHGLREALLYGDWDSFSGQVFAEWKNDPAHYGDRTRTHVIAPFKIPREWGVWCSLDWGYSKPFSVGWYAVDPERRLYRIREYYGCTGTPDEGLLLEPSAVAREIRRIEEEDPNLKGRRIQRVGDPAIWNSDGTESIGALFERERVYIRPGKNARIAGKMQAHHRLAFDAAGKPGLYVFSTCGNFIRTFPALNYSKSDVEDVDTSQEDHIYDELRYVCMENPVAPKAPLAPAFAKNDRFDPLERLDYMKVL